MAGRPSLRGSWRIRTLGEQSLASRGGEAALVFGPRNRGTLRVGRIRCELDCRHGVREGCPSVAFSFAGTEDGRPISGRGVAALVDGRVHGHLFFHLGHEGVFMAERGARRTRSASSVRRARRGRAPRRRRAG